MNWRALVIVTLGLFATVVGNALADEAPDIRNTKLAIMAVDNGLASAMTQIMREHDEDVWVGYRVPVRPGMHMCCGNWNCRTCECDLESRHQSYNSTTNDDDILDSRFMHVLARLEKGDLKRIRAFSEDCRLNAHDVPFIWLTDVRSDESIAWLRSLVDDEKNHSMDRIVEPAISTIAMHDDPTALDALERFVDTERPEDVREHAVFWIGESGGLRGVNILKRLLRDDPSSDVREKAIFALTLPDEPEAVDALIEAARHDRSSDVRSNALFWLSNKAGKRAADAISNAIEDDPDADVKEKAVFALSQLPDDEGIPLLIKVARTNRSRDVREKAIFWLGQSDDPRVIDFFEEVLRQ